MPESTPIVIHGSTGSIGTQTLDVIHKLRGQRDFDVFALVCNEDITTLRQQILDHNPAYAVVANKQAARRLKESLDRQARNTVILAGQDEATEICSHIKGGYVVIATAGFAGLAPTLAAIQAGNTVAIANKEAFLTAGKLIMDASRANDVEVLPIDSEPSAIWQAIRGEVKPVSYGQRRSEIWNLQRGADHNIDHWIHTCSGGPFLDAETWPAERLDRVTPAEALQHPTWNMGKLITTRSADLMNKGMEAIEISSIFGLPVERTRILINRQSLLHSGVVLKDGHVAGILAPHDMRYPIAYALTYPDRFDIGLPRLDLAREGRLDFAEPDWERFPSLDIAIRAGVAGGTAPAVLNGANEVAVDLFHEGKILFTDMARLAEHALDNHNHISNPTLADIRRSDSWAREHTARVYETVTTESRRRMKA